jgi:hypothetical protein
MQNLYTCGPWPQINLIPIAGLNFLTDIMYAQLPTPDFICVRSAPLRKQID